MDIYREALFACEQGRQSRIGLLFYSLILAMCLFGLRPPKVAEPPGSPRCREVAGVAGQRSPQPNWQMTLRPSWGLPLVDPSHPGALSLLGALWPSQFWPKDW